MHDFDLSPRSTNSIVAGKRPRSNMTPILILREGKPYIVIGSSGGPRIVSAIFQVLLNIIEYGMGIKEAINAPRIHYAENMIKLESRIKDNMRRALHKLGAKTSVPDYLPILPGYDAYFGGVNVIIFSKDGFIDAAADPRRGGYAKILR